MQICSSQLHNEHSKIVKSLLKFFSSLPELEATVDDLLTFLSRILKHFNHRNPEQVSGLHEMISLFLYATAKLKETTRDHNTCEKMGILRALVCDDWIVKDFSKYFFCPFGVQRQSLPDFIKYAKMEIEV